MKRYLLDACALIAYFNDEDGATPDFKQDSRF